LPVAMKTDHRSLGAAPRIAEGDKRDTGIARNYLAGLANSRRPSFFIGPGRRSTAFASPARRPSSQGLSK
jgi:hypothetical protein